MPRGIRSTIVMPALVNGSAASDRISIPSGAAIDSLSASTHIGWFNPSALGGNYALFVKGPGRYLVEDGLVPSKLQYVAGRATTATNYNTVANTVVVNIWQCFAATFDINASTGNVVKFYRGTLSSVLAAVAPGTTAVDGVGTLTSDAGSAQLVGNYTNFALAFRGLIGPLGIFRSVLSLADMQSWAANTRPAVGGRYGLYFEPGADGTVIVRDLSGLGYAGTVTGATVSLSRGPTMSVDAFHRLGRQRRRSA